MPRDAHLQESLQRTAPFEHQANEAIMRSGAYAMSGLAQGFQMAQAQQLMALQAQEGQARMAELQLKQQAFNQEAQNQAIIQDLRRQRAEADMIVARARMMDAQTRRDRPGRTPRYVQGVGVWDGKRFVADEEADQRILKFHKERAKAQAAGRAEGDPMAFTRSVEFQILQQKLESLGLSNQAKKMESEINQLIKERLEKRR